MKKTSYLLLLAVLFSACCKKQKNPETTVIQDPNNRHYTTPWINQCVSDINLESFTLNKPKTTPEENFNIGKEGGIEAVWGRGVEAKGHFFEKLLPDLFFKRVEFDEMNLQDGKLYWIFTGKQGGVTLEIADKAIRITQKYYNSFGFNKVTGQTLLSYRHPVSYFIDTTIVFHGALKSLTLEKKHNVMLELRLNDSLVARQMTYLDLSRHQLKYTGIKGNIKGEMQEKSIEDVTVFVDETKKYQEIIGFGGIASPIAYHLFSEEGKTQWFNWLKEYNLLIQREYPNGHKLKEDMSNFDVLEDATVHYYGDNFPNGEISDFSYNKKIQEMGGYVVFEFWGLPDWATDKRDKIDSSVSVHQWKQKPLLDKYVDAMVGYCKKALEKTGQAPRIVGIQNEKPQEAAIWQQMAIRLRKGLDEAGFNEVKIHMHNAPNLVSGIGALRDFQANDSAWNSLDYTAVNVYDYQQYFHDPDGYDSLILQWQQLAEGKKLYKEFISSEISVNYAQHQAGSYSLAFVMGELYHKNMVMMNAASLMYCWMLINAVQESYPASRCLFRINETNGFVPEPSSFQLRVFGSYSRHLPMGMVRVECQSPDPDLLCSCYSFADKKTMIITNRSSSPKKISSAWLSHFKTMEITNQYYQNQLLPVPDELIVEGGSIITLFK